MSCGKGKGSGKPSGKPRETSDRGNKNKEEADAAALLAQIQNLQSQIKARSY